MWNRQELKQNAKAAFKKNYWPCVLVAILLSILTAAAIGYVGKTTIPDVSKKLSELNMTSSEIFAAIGAAASIGTVALIIAILIKMFITNPLTVGGYRFFVRNSEEDKPGIGVVFSAFKDGRFGSVFITMLLRDIFLALWSILFVIPGIVKFYSYRMVPYLLADHPEMGATEIITKSRQMMNGQKWKAFVLDLSFLLWYLLTAVTFGFAGVFYVSPYVEATNAELYRVLSGKSAQ